MKNNVSYASVAVFSQTRKIFLIAAVVLALGMLVFAGYHVSRTLRASVPTPIVAETNAADASVPPLPSDAILTATVLDNSPAAAPAVGQPSASQFEVVRQREQARLETIEALKRAAQERAGTNALSREEIKRIEQSDPYIQ